MYSPIVVQASFNVSLLVIDPMQTESVLLTVKCVLLKLSLEAMCILLMIQASRIICRSIETVSRFSYSFWSPGQL